jgi:hypothetical protein
MIIASRIPGMTGTVRLATIRAADRRPRVGHDQYLIDELERRGYWVMRVERPA